MFLIVYIDILFRICCFQAFGYYRNLIDAGLSSLCCNASCHSIEDFHVASGGFKAALLDAVGQGPEPFLYFN
jgi:hypothetical protein